MVRHCTGPKTPRPDSADGQAGHGHLSDLVLDELEVVSPSVADKQRFIKLSHASLSDVVSSKLTARDEQEHQSITGIPYQGSSPVADPAGRAEYDKDGDYNVQVLRQ